MLSHRPWKSVSRLQPHWLKSLRPFQFCFKINEIILEYESTFENISLRVSFLEQTDKSEAESEMLDKDSSISWRGTNVRICPGTHAAYRLTWQFPFLSTRPKNISGTRFKDSALCNLDSLTSEYKSLWRTQQPCKFVYTCNILEQYSIEASKYRVYSNSGSLSVHRNNPRFSENWSERNSVSSVEI